MTTLLDAFDRAADILDPPPNPYEERPVAFIEHELNEAPWSKQREIAQSVLDHRYTCVRSCHGTGKSYLASRLMAWWIACHPIGEAFVVSTAPTQTQVEAILWREVGKAHRKGSLVGRITGGMVPAWKIGAEIVGYGRKPQDLQSKEDAMAAFSGIHARFVLIIIDEAGGVPKWLFDAVDTLATNASARVLAIGNPDDPASEFAKINDPGSGWHSIKIAFDDTPNFTGEEVDERLREDLISPVWVEERRAAWGEKSPLFISKVLGEFPDVSDDTLIAPKDLIAAQNRTIVPDQDLLGSYGYDIARLGSDETVGYRNIGGRIRLVYSRSKQTTMRTAAAIKIETQRHLGEAPTYIDVIGIGAGVYDRCAEWGLGVIPFSSSERAYNPQRFGNRRAEVYWQFKEDIERGVIDLPDKGEDDELFSQLSAIKYFLRNGRIWIESKDDMKKRGMPSPDRADAAVMSNIRGAAMPKRTRHQAGDPDPPGAISKGIMKEQW